MCLSTHIPPNYDLQIHATHGFSRKPSISQLLIYILNIFYTICAVFCVYEILQNLTLLILTIICVQLTQLISILGTIIDPTDPIIYQQKWAQQKHQKIKIQISQYKFCENCQLYCQKNSRHCKKCNRCCSDFDHHCPWINSCVGDKNYKFFMMLVIGCAVSKLIILITGTLASFQADYENSDHIKRLIPLWIMMLISLIFLPWLVYLIILQIYLRNKGIKVYQYLEKNKVHDQDKEKNIQKQNQEKNTTQLKKVESKITTDESSQINLQSSQVIKSVRS